jgi:hypothetical protein
MTISIQKYINHKMAINKPIIAQDEEKYKMITIVMMMN